MLSTEREGNMVPMPVTYADGMIQSKQDVSHSDSKINSGASVGAGGGMTVDSAIDIENNTVADNVKAKMNKRKIDPIGNGDLQPDDRVSQINRSHDDTFLETPKVMITTMQQRTGTQNPPVDAIQAPAVPADPDVVEGRIQKLQKYKQVMHIAASSGASVAMLRRAEAKLKKEADALLIDVFSLSPESQSDMA